MSAGEARALTALPIEILIDIAARVGPYGANRAAIHSTCKLLRSASATAGLSAAHLLCDEHVCLANGFSRVDASTFTVRRSQPHQFVAIL